jgi:predicted nuclease of restriction endonuclease-like (RecB) superfamily
MKEIRTAVPAGYAEFLTDLKRRIQTAQLRASLAVNRELVQLYWAIGREILARQREDGWGTGVIERLARDLRSAFPGMQGLSPRNLGYMKAFAEAWPEERILQQVVAKLPWGHNVRLVERVKDSAERLWYAERTLANGWSRNVLVLQIEAGLYRRQGKAITNFDRTLPPPQSDLAQQITKDPYNFDFLTLGPEAHERDLERGLLEHLRDFLLELGVGFAFLGSQYRIQVGEEEFWLDLLFYHVKLRAYVVIDLKMQSFRPEFAGKMNFYLSAVNNLLRHPDDQPSIGLILCKTRDRVVAEYSLQDVSKPIGVSEYRLAAALPEKLKGTLPTIEEIESELSDSSE